jgi:hypothetical protein
MAFGTELYPIFSSLGFLLATEVPDTDGGFMKYAPHFVVLGLIELGSESLFSGMCRLC